jgi:UDP-N-acetylglucosamine 1-carboxyvinyltransferase
MSRFIIQGGRPLTGEISVNGAKNEALKVLVSTLISSGPIKVANVPELADVHRMMEILADLGVAKEKTGEREYTFSPSDLESGKLTPELVNKLRASTLLIGPLLARVGEVSLPHPGGCKIGRRPIDLFLNSLTAMGAKIEEAKSDSYKLKAQKLKGARIVLPKISVTLTETLMMTAVLAEGTTEIVNAALEPEIPALAGYLNSKGAKISGAGTPFVKIEGSGLVEGGEYALMPDRIETGSFAALAAATGGEITIKNCNPSHIEVPLEILKEMGTELKVGESTLRVKADKLKAVNFATHEYPGFATDLQPPFTVALTRAQGASLVHETIFEGRLFYIDELNKMGADIILADPHRAIVNGPTKLYGRTIVSPDARAGLALIIAALMAEGETTIDNIYQVDRGYERIEERLQALGAEIKRVE